MVELRRARCRVVWWWAMVVVGWLVVVLWCRRLLQAWRRVRDRERARLDLVDAVVRVVVYVGCSTTLTLLAIRY